MHSCQAKGRWIESEWPKVSFECQILCTCWCHKESNVGYCSDILRSLEITNIVYGCRVQGVGSWRSNSNSLISGQWRQICLSRAGKKSPGGKPSKLNPTGKTSATPDRMSLIHDSCLLCRPLKWFLEHSRAGEFHCRNFWLYIIVLLHAKLCIVRIKHVLPSQDASNI